MPFLPPPFYPLTDNPGGHQAQILRLLEAGARMIQLRDKEADGRSLLQELDRVLPLMRAAGALLVVNDRADLARLAGAGGCTWGSRICL